MKHFLFDKRHGTVFIIQHLGHILSVTIPQMQSQITDLYGEMNKRDTEETTTSLLGKNL